MVDATPHARFGLGLPLCVALTLATPGCGATTWNPTIQPVGAAPAESSRSMPLLKVHMNDGGLFVLRSWDLPEQDQVLQGVGWEYDQNRELLSDGPHSIELDGIALLETNDRRAVSRFAFTGLSFFTSISALTTGICLADPKSCFGSCPTFYLDDEQVRPVAEGFSSSFARALEERDVDRLGLRRGGGTMSLVMRNEAYETHAVRHVRLLAAEVRGGEEALLDTNGRVVAVRESHEPLTCASLDGDCLESLRVADDVEYASVTDSTDLGAREHVLLRFGAVEGDVGLDLTARSSLVSTYLFYQSLAYAGTRVGDMLAALERGEPGVRDRVLGLAQALGPIEVWFSVDGEPWHHAGSFDEAGPIAADRRLIRLGSLSAEDLRVELRMARGAWRLDDVGIVGVGSIIEPIVLEPDSVTATEPTVPDAHGRLVDPEAHLVTVPGDSYRLWFTVPHGGSYDLLLDSRGYYYEWMREEWLGEEDPERTAVALLAPEEALRAMAPAFKEMESRMEALFWASRFRGR